MKKNANIASYILAALFVFLVAEIVVLDLFGDGSISAEVIRRALIATSLETSLVVVIAFILTCVVCFLFWYGAISPIVNQKKNFEDNVAFLAEKVSDQDTMIRNDSEAARQRAENARQLNDKITALEDGNEALSAANEELRKQCREKQTPESVQAALEQISEMTANVMGVVTEIKTASTAAEIVSGEMHVSSNHLAGRMKEFEEFVKTALSAMQGDAEAIEEIVSATSNDAPASTRSERASVVALSKIIGIAMMSTRDVFEGVDAAVVHVLSLASEMYEKGLLTQEGLISIAWCVGKALKHNDSNEAQEESDELIALGKELDPRLQNI